MSVEPDRRRIRRDVSARTGGSDSAGSTAAGTNMVSGDRAVRLASRRQVNVLRRQVASRDTADRLARARAVTLSNNRGLLGRCPASPSTAPVNTSIAGPAPA